MSPNNKPNVPALVEPREYEALLVARQDRLAQLLAGSDIPPAKFIGMTVQALARDPKLRAPDVDKESVLLGILTVAEMGLAPSGAFGGAYLVPFFDRDSRKKKVQPIIDWRAFIKMALQSGQIRSAWAHVVYEGDEFSYQYGDDPRLEHIPGLTREKITHAYAVAKLLDGSRQFEVMPVADIEVIRSRSRNGDSGPWVDDYPEMCRKTAVRRLFKYLPVAITPQLAAALQAEDDWEGEFREVTPARQLSSRQARLLAAARGEAGEEPAAAEANGHTQEPAAEPGESVSGDADAEEAAQAEAEADEGLPE